MAKRRKLATLFVDFVADKTGLKRDMRSAEEDVKRSSDNMERSSKKASRSIGEVGESIEKRIAPLDKFTSAIGKVAGVLGPIGVAAGVAAAAIAGLGKALLAGENRAEAFERKLDQAAVRLASLSEQIRKTQNEKIFFDDSGIASINAQITELEQKIQDKRDKLKIGTVEGFFTEFEALWRGAQAYFTGEGTFKAAANVLFAEIEDDISSLEVEADRLGKLRDDKKVKSRKDFLERIRDLELQNADEEVRIREEAQRQIDELREFEENAPFFVDPEEIQRGIDAIKKDRDARLKALEEKREAERQRQKEQEDAEKQALENEKKRAQEAADAKEKAEMEAEKRLHEQRLDNIRRETEARRKAIQEIEQATASSIDALTGRFNNQAHVFKQIDESLRRIADQGVGEAAF